MTVIDTLVNGSEKVSDAKMDWGIVHEMHEVSKQKIYKMKNELKLLSDQMKAERLGQ